jgi:hypothetical protein
MAQLKIGVQSEEVQRLIGQFDQLSKAEQKMVVGGSALGNTLDKSAKSGADSFGRLGVTMRGVLGSLLGIGSSAGVMATVVARARQHFQEIEQMQQRAADTQMTWSDATGAFVANNPQMDEGDIRKFMGFAMEQGRTLGAGGPQKVLRGLTALRSGTPGASDEQQLAAVERAVMQAQIDPQTDIGAFSTAIIKLQQSAGIDSVKASSLLTMFGARAGGDIAGLSGQIGKLLGVQNVAATDTADILSLFGFLTAESGDATGEQSVTTVQNLLSKIMTRDLKIGGKSVNLEAETGIGRLFELLDRIETGEFGDERTAMAMAARQLMQGATGVAALGNIAAGRSRLIESQGMISGVLDSDVDFTAQQLARKRAVLPAEGSIRRSAESGGELALTEINDQDSERARVRARLKQNADQFGVTGATEFMRVRDIFSQLKGQSPAEFEEEQRMRLLAKSLSVPMDAAQEAAILGVGGSAAAAKREIQPQAMALLAEQGIEGQEAEILARAMTFGSINAGGGIDRSEANALQKFGVERAVIAEASKLYNEGQKEAFAEAFRAIMAELSESMAAAMARQMQSSTARGQAQNLDLITQ